MATSQEDMPEPRTPEVKCDILGADWNQGVSQLAQQFKEFIEKNKLTPVPPELLALRKGDCCGFLVFPGCQACQWFVMPGKKVTMTWKLS
jgi:hypothetical protein